MKKVLIVAGDTTSGNQFQETLSLAGFYTAVVGSARAMIDFCQQNSPDLCLIDVDNSGGDLWTSVQGLKSLRDLANLPLLGISNVASEETLLKAKQHGFGGMIPKSSTPEFFVTSIQSLFMEPAQSKPAAIAPPSNLQRLTDLSSEVAKVSDNLKDNLVEFGDDGPELFGYIENACVQISDKLSTVSKDDLFDKEVRHDFRNMIGSVTGFSELILMEPALSPVSQQGFTRLRECSKEFVELLDEQKN